MTKPEPLKGKMYIISSNFGETALKKDVRSAVEWLKQELRKGDEDWDCVWGDKIIDEAFEDVMKK
jgi:hypothetical protein